MAMQHIRKKNNKFIFLDPEKSVRVGMRNTYFLLFGLTRIFVLTIINYFVSGRKINGHPILNAQRKKIICE